MRVRWGFSLLLLFLIVAGTAAPATAADATKPHRTALDDYVNKPDDSYKWEIIRTHSRGDYKVFVLHLVSQTWRTKEDVDRPLWEHTLVVVRPDELASDKGFLLIGGGRNGRNREARVDDFVVKMAVASKSVVAQLGMVPNQTLMFHGDGENRVEDDLIGYTWDQFLKTGDKTWPARNPMVKSAVRAMDAITELLASKEGGEAKVDKFVVAGGSKRGWTTWLTGAVDERVIAIVPIVIDVLNVNTSMKHHFAAYGFWAPAVGNYYQHKIMQRMDDPKLDDLYELVDPFAYRSRLTMPKFIVNSAGDQFFLPDSSQFYFDELVGEKHLRYVPNSDHGLDGTDAIESILAFYMMVINDIPRPEFDWTFPEDGSIVVTPKTPPKAVKLWQAHNPNARDFRLERLGPEYKSTDLEPSEDGKYIAKIEKPEKGFTAFFVEMTYDVGVKVPLKFTTAVRVLPDVLPYADLDPTEGKIEDVPKRRRD